MTAASFFFSWVWSSGLSEHDFAVRRRELDDEAGIGRSLDCDGDAERGIEPRQRLGLGMGHSEGLQAAAAGQARRGVRRLPPVDDERDRLAEARVLEIED